MSREVEAVIAALEVVLADAKASHEYDFASEIANRWIDQLPGAWIGRWRNLKLKSSPVSREEFVTHVRATLAYLEANREGIQKMKLWNWSVPASEPKPSNPKPVEPIDAEFVDVRPAAVKKLPKPKKPPPNFK